MNTRKQKDDISVVSVLHISVNYSLCWQSFTQSTILRPSEFLISLHYGRLLKHHTSSLPFAQTKSTSNSVQMNSIAAFQLMILSCCVICMGVVDKIMGHHVWPLTNYLRKR
ncbi:hypothetical protein KC19_11G031400 [Ceratodon purpureus]|uniref:Uncharacterized protein n=1 Tax=Ceratodon purpureus TaxID=3225 RepID=A0A8T0GBR3_CERPU|nr:hypothetical protein KC19_11G031400 [Ceratodon purpureus]